MLVISRKAGQGIVIDNTTRVQIISVRSTRTTIEVEAPENISIRRSDGGKAEFGSTFVLFAKEAILIGNFAEMKVLSFEKGRVQVGIEAPKNITILREELVGIDLPTNSGESTKSMKGC